MFNIRNYFIKTNRKYNGRIIWTDSNGFEYIFKKTPLSKKLQPCKITNGGL